MLEHRFFNKLLDLANVALRYANRLMKRSNIRSAYVSLRKDIAN